MMILKNFLMMGGYASFVWPAYLIGLLVLGLNSFLSFRLKHRITQKILKEQQRAKLIENEYQTS